MLLKVLMNGKTVAAFKEKRNYLCGQLLVDGLYLQLLHCRRMSLVIEDVECHQVVNVFVTLLVQQDAGDRSREVQPGGVHGHGHGGLRSRGIQTGISIIQTFGK